MLIILSPKIDDYTEIGPRVDTPNTHLPRRDIGLLVRLRSYTADPPRPTSLEGFSWQRRDWNIRSFGRTKAVYLYRFLALKTINVEVRSSMNGRITYRWLVCF